MSSSKAQQLRNKRRDFIQHLAQLGGLGALAWLPAAQVWAAGGARVSAVRASLDAEQSRLVFDLDGPVNHTLFTLTNPYRVVIDIENTQMLATAPSIPGDSPLLRGIRSAPRQQKHLRVVLDLTGQARAQSFLLKPDGVAGYRLVVDLHGNGGPAVKRTAPSQQRQGLRDVIIAIDPGHGGRDPGATGRLGTQEKEVTLAIGRRLATMLQQQQGMTAVLIRDSDEFLPLRDRVNKAHDARADLMVSLHADAFKDSSARGASVYALSLRGASSEAAKWLADKENAADLIGGISIRDKDDLVASVLLDLAQTATIQSSLDIGSHVLRHLSQVGRVHKPRVQQAGFAVLKNPDIPSILVETAFISNPNEERNLRSVSHQDKLAKALVQGIRGYFSQKAPPGTLLSANQEPLRG